MKNPFKYKQYGYSSSAGRAIRNFKKNNPDYDNYIFGINQLDYGCYEINMYKNTQNNKNILSLAQFLS